jgi:hypothetical protein
MFGKMVQGSIEYCKPGQGYRWQGRKEWVDARGLVWIEGGKAYVLIRYQILTQRIWNGLPRREIQGVMGRPQFAVVEEE